MWVIESGPLRPRWSRLVAVAALTAMLAACGSDQAAPDETGTTGTGAAPATPGEGEAPAAAAAREADDALAAMSVEELRTVARQAYAESRLYAPEQDNALEYYLALRERVPGDPVVSSALTDLLPMTVIATEQSRDREDYEEARRLQELIQRASPEHPALPRLSATIDEAQELTAQRIEQQQLSAEQEVERQRQLEAERAREQEEQQAEAARLAQEEAEQEEADRLAAEEQREAERIEAEREAAERRAQAEAREAEAQEAATASQAPELRALSTQAPRYPTDALRARQAGEVLVEFTVNPDGSVSNARVVRAEPARVFDREAVAAVRRWRFEPVSEPVTTRRMIGFTPGE